jgi:hypothetical protein
MRSVVAVGCALAMSACGPFTLPPSTAPVHDPPTEALPEGYGGSFGGWAKEVKCRPFGDCVKGPAHAPAHAEIASYTSARSPGGRVAPGETVHVCSRIFVVAGSDGKPAHAFEGIVLSAKGGESGRLIKGINPTGRGGEFLTDFALEMPKETPSGAYTVRTTLFLDKRSVDSHILTFEVGPGAASPSSTCTPPPLPGSGH